MQEVIQQVLDNSYGSLLGTKIQNLELLSNSSIQQIWSLYLDTGQRLFVKTSDANSYQRLSFEANGLRALKSFSDQNLLLIPEVLLLKKIGAYSVLILPWLQLDKGDESLLGKGLADLHLRSSKKKHISYGWDDDGYIGLGIQPSGWERSWGSCFINLRLKPQIKVAAQWGFKIDKLEQTLLAIESYLNHHKPLPTLVHGDLWSGNCAIAKNGSGILIDPACWWADREVDIAMTKLFGGFSEKFYKSYEKKWPLNDSYVNRLDIYNLYHIINHANIFGGSYKNQSIDIIQEIKQRLL